MRKKNDDLAETKKYMSNMSQQQQHLSPSFRHQPSQLDYSLSEINSNKFMLKSALVYYSSNVKAFAKWFEIGDIIKNEDTFTVYQVVYRVRYF